ncbi:MAG: hypothetical protein ACIALR_12370, partial [Blastopirellula sp. JB062]
DEGFISIENRKRLLAEARQWGVARAEAGQIIEEHIASIERRAKRRRRRVFAAVMVATLTLFGGLSIIYWQPNWSAWSDWAGLGAVDSSEPGLTGSAGEANVDEEAYPRLTWWSEALVIDLFELRQREEKLKPATTAIAIDDEKKRAEGYAELIPQIVDALALETNATHVDQFQTIVRLLAVNEPGDIAFEKLIDSLAKNVPAKESEITSKSNFEKQYAAAELLIEIAEQPELPTERRDRIVASLERRLGVVAGPTADLSVVFVDELARNQYAALERLAENDPTEAMAAHQHLQPVVRNAVNRVLAGDLNGDALLAILPRAPKDLNAYRSVLDEQINQRNLAVLLRLIELLENGKLNRSVRRDLQSLLAKAVDVTVDGMAATDAAIVMRNALAGLAGQGDVGEMARFFAGQAHPIQLLESEFGSPDEWLTDAVNFSRISALGAAAAKKESGRRLFQSLSSDVPEPIRPAKRNARKSAAPERVGRVQDAFRQLARTADPRRRIMAYQNLATMMAGRSDLDYRSAERLVEYLLAKKLPEEQEQIVRRLSDFRGCGMLRLAFSDHLEETIMPLSELQRMATAIVGRSVVLNDKTTWKEDLRRILLTDALPRLHQNETLASEDVSSDVLEQSAAGLLDYYRIQAEIAGIPYERRIGMQVPSDALQALIQQQSDQLAAAQLSPEQRSQFDEIMRRLRVVSLVANNDLAMTVALQRIWLELSALEAVRLQPNSRLAADQLIARLKQVDQGSQNVFQQIRNGEAALVRMQLIRMET